MEWGRDTVLEVDSKVKSRFLKIYNEYSLKYDSFWVLNIDWLEENLR